MKSHLPASLLELRVLAGRQLGARARLDAQHDLLVCGLNSANQADTQFADILLASEIDFQLRVIPSGAGRVSLQLVSGHAVLAEHALMPGTAIHAWAPGQRLQLGDAIVAYGPADQDYWPEPVLHDGPELPASERAQGMRAPIAAPRARPVLEGVLTALGLVMVVGGVSLAWRGGTLREAGQVVAKVVPPAQAATAATAPDLLASAVEVFRLYGIAAQAAWSPEGELVLRTQERDATRVQAAAAAAKRDIAHLPALRIDNRPPVATAAAPAPAPDDPAKRLVAVVDNADSPYFITADGSRYFSGALLPSGHRVVQIAGRAVIVERDGQQTRLTL